MYRYLPTCPQAPVSHNRLAWLFNAPHEAETNEIRVDLVERVRREIAEGTYETPEKWEAALAGLARDLE
jgi:hypothetical protein